MIKFCILIPVYNESKTLGNLIKKLKETDYNYKFINDGSTDDTLDILYNYKVPYLTYPKNKGKGFAIKHAVYPFISNYAYYLIIDGDNQHSLEDIPNFLKMAEKYPEIALFIGNRLKNRLNMLFIRYITNVFMSWVIFLMIGQKLDTQCGFRLIRKDVFDLDLKSNRFEFETEMLIKASKAGLKIKSLPIHTIYHKDRISKVNPIKDTIRFLKMLWRCYN